MYATKWGSQKSYFSFPNYWYCLSFAMILKNIFFVKKWIKILKLKFGFHLLLLQKFYYLLDVKFVWTWKAHNFCIIYCIVLHCIFCVPMYFIKFKCILLSLFSRALNFKCYYMYLHCKFRDWVIITNYCIFTG